MLHLLRKLLICVALPTFLTVVPAHAAKWASATFHTKQPIDQVFEPTANLMASKEWYIGTRWHIEFSDITGKTIQASTVSFGQQWGEIYVWMSSEGTGTRIKAVLTLHAGAHLHPADYAERFGKGLKKIFPDLTYEIERDRTPTDFAFGPPQVSIPLVPTAVATESPSVSVTQNSSSTQIVQIGQPGGNLFTAIAEVEQEREENAELKDRQMDEVIASNAVKQFLGVADEAMTQYLATVGGGAAGQFPVTAKAINGDRDSAYAKLSNPIQRAMFNHVANSRIITFENQMSEHARQQASASQVADQEQVTDNLHRALDAWYANGKDWTKISPEIWNKLSERDKGRLKDGVDPELGIRR